jgi:hypothetical protein
VPALAHPLVWRSSGVGAIAQRASSVVGAAVPTCSGTGCINEALAHQRAAEVKVRRPTRAVPAPPGQEPDRLVEASLVHDIAEQQFALCLKIGRYVPLDLWRAPSAFSR